MERLASRYAMDLIKGEVFSNVEAWSANAFLLDQQNMAFLYPRNKLTEFVIDMQKIDSVKVRVM